MLLGDLATLQGIAVKKLKRPLTSNEKGQVSTAKTQFARTKFAQVFLAKGNGHVVVAPHITAEVKQVHLSTAATLDCLISRQRDNIARAELIIANLEKAKELETT